MRRKARATKASHCGAQGNANSNIKARENTDWKVVKQTRRPAKTLTGKGLGKAGAKRLVQQLKRALRDETGLKGKASPPKTPIRLFKHHIQTGAESAPKTNTAKPASPHVSQLILSVVSQYKHRSGMPLAELKKTLAAGGNVTKNSRQVNIVTKRLVNSETLVRTRRNASLRLNNKKQADTKQVRTSSVKFTKPNSDLKQSKTASKSTKGAEKLERQAKKTPKPKGKSHKPKSKIRRAAPKPHTPRRKTLKTRKNKSKPAGKKRRSAKNRVTWVRKAPKKAQRARNDIRINLPGKDIHKDKGFLKQDQGGKARRRTYDY